jgi:hypothetical protein
MQVTSITPSAGTTINSVSAPDPLSRYLSLPTINKSEIDRMGGLIKYWSRDEEQSSPLARMALDVLTAPGTCSIICMFHFGFILQSILASSVDAERAFSGGRMTVNYQQHRMSLATFGAKMAIGAWYGTPLMEDVEEALDILEDRSLTPEPLD